MIEEHRVEEALKALAAADAGVEAPPHREARLLDAYRRRHRRGAWRKAAPWAIAAALVLGFALSRLATPAREIVGRPSPARDALVPLEPSRGPAADQAIRPTPKRALVEPVETTTEFYTLMDIAPPFERGELVRVTLPAAAMRRVGIPVREERLLEPVQADILIGQEGLARAIRFVRFEP